MAINYSLLSKSPRLLIESSLRPLQGNRIQATGFPDLGPARYTVPQRSESGELYSVEMLLVESAQSVANRLEMTCWNDADECLIPELDGLPYIQVLQDGKKYTNSILEAHRINSPYILEGSDRTVYDRLKHDAAGLESGPVRIRDLAKLVFKYDVNAVLHGVFLAKKELAGGRLRLSRSLSGFIEGKNVSIVESGGVKNDRVDPSGSAKQGFGNVPFHRTEFTVESLTGYFNLDLALLRGYDLGENATRLLIALSLFKIRRFLSSGLRLRTACDLDADDPRATRPVGFSIPSEEILLSECRRLIPECKDLFADPPVTSVKWSSEKKSKSGKSRDKT